MKLCEIAKTKTQGQEGISSKITDFLESYDIHNKNYFVHPNGVVDLKYSASLSSIGEIDRYGVGNTKTHPMIVGKLPVKFGTVKNNFNASCNDLTTLEGCPTLVGGTFSCSMNARLTSLEHMPKEIGKDCQCAGTGIISLIGISDYVKHIGGEFYTDFGNIKEGGLGLIMIDSLSGISGTANSSITKPFRIIKKYLGRPDDIFECQEELIKAGFEAYAQL